jgi:hypothetical protein
VRHASNSEDEALKRSLLSELGGIAAYILLLPFRSAWWLLRGLGHVFILIAELIPDDDFDWIDWD